MYSTIRHLFYFTLMFAQLATVNNICIQREQFFIRDNAGREHKLSKMLENA